MSRILVVDDEPLLGILLADWLDELGHETIGPARDVASASALLDAALPDAAIIDVSLGSETGYPIAEYLMKRGVPFVFGTGHGQGGLPPCFSRHKILVKPYEFDALGDILKKLLAEPVG
jgi:DNA-binding response OmpR family regulator